MPWILAASVVVDIITPGQFVCRFLKTLVPTSRTVFLTFRGDIENAGIAAFFFLASYAHSATGTVSNVIEYLQQKRMHYH
jgi:hypothetical protein